MITAEIEQKLQSGELQIITRTALNVLLSKARQDIRKQICSTNDAMEILDVEYKAFYTLLKDPKCLIKPSSKKGKYVLQSVYDEANRLNS